MCTSWLTQRAAASLEEASKARLATKANSTRSTRGSRRAVRSLRSTLSMPSRCHMPSSTCAPPRGGVQQPGQGGDQPLDRGRVDLVGPAEAVEDLGARRLRRRVPLVVDQLQVRHLRAVLVPPPHLPQEHVLDTISITTG